ncbi:alkaline phosphatase family protein [Sulfolobus tengchongensis]|uniref:Alkaline phosphatase family protein n=1 Tax=Sulfolobus tengchongensis TaxID=207809 RepID=A0AAX4L2D9_9CREN
MEAKKLAYISLLLVFFSVLTVFNTMGYAVTTQTPIKHVIIIILENHAFDSIFGTYPFGYPPIVNNITLNLMRPVNYIYNLSLVNILKQNNGNITWITLTYGNKTYHPYYANTTVLKDPLEGYNYYHIDWNYGKMNGFINGSGVQSLAYISYEQVPLLWDYAEEYVLFDNYFSPTLSLTVPNRIDYIVGFPAPVNSDAPQFGELPINDSILYQLSENNISWGWYEYGYSQDYQILSPDLYLGYNNTAPLPVSLLKGANMWNSHYHDLTDFLNQAKNGSLPAVSFVMFTGIMGYDDHIPGYDIHPPYNTTLAMLAIMNVINAVMEGPDWNSSAIFITFDEGGGYYDQVPPPIIQGNGYDPAITRYLPGYFSLGQRIPLLVISPYAKEGFIDNYTASGYSILAFIDYDFNLPYLTPIVKELGPQSILYAFNFSMKPRPPIILTPSNWTYPIPLQYPIHYGYVATINNNYTTYQLLYQKMGIGNYSLPKYFVIANANSVKTQTSNTSIENMIPLIIVVIALAIFVSYLVLYKKRNI